MPVMPPEHSFTAVLKSGFSITTVFASSVIDAKIKAADEMRVPPLRKYFDGWARDGYKMIDGGAAE